MKILLILFLLFIFKEPVLAGDNESFEHKERATFAEGKKPKPSHYHSPPLPPPKGKEVRKVAVDEPGAGPENFGVLSMHDNEPFFQVMTDRLEFRNDDHDQIVLWDTDIWWGNDYDKVYFESEGEWNNEGSTESTQLELFWNHTIASFWDTQLGVRHDLAPKDSRTFLAAGVQGLAPYIFEVDATFYLSEEADPSFIFEIERDFLFTQRLILTPRIESQIAFSNVPDYDLRAGFTNVEVGARLRYEFYRKFAPYIGISSEYLVGETRNIRQEKGVDPSKTFLVAGLKFWF